MIEKGVPLLLENLKEATNSELKAALLSAFADISLIKGINLYSFTIPFKFTFIYNKIKSRNKY